VKELINEGIGILHGTQPVVRFLGIQELVKIARITTQHTKSVDQVVYVDNWGGPPDSPVELVNRQNDFPLRACSNR